MGKGKPRHNPDKLQNKKGRWCGACEEIDGKLNCNYGEDTSICKGNPHNCIKTLYHTVASLSDKQKENGVIPNPYSKNVRRTNHGY